MVKYKLIFFNAKGLGETVRWIFAVAGVEFEDCRLEPKDWKDEKPKMPFGQLPVLEVDGKPLAQTKAICRYLAKEFSLVGKDRWEEARGDMVVDYVDDLRKPVLTILQEKDEERRKLTSQLFREEQLPTFLKNFEKTLTENNGGDGYFVGDKLTWCDIVFATTMSVLRTFAEKYNMDYPLTGDKYPKLSALVTRVEEHPAIVDWKAKHPDPEPVAPPPPKPESSEPEAEAEAEDKAEGDTPAAGS